jgi:hypothetical protein
MSWMPHWIAIFLGAGALSIPFQAYLFFQCGALNPNVTAPFTYYQYIISSINLVVVGAYIMAAGYTVFGLALVSLGGVMACVERILLGLWYRRNPEYTWRLLRSDSGRGYVR